MTPTKHIFRSFQANMLCGLAFLLVLDALGFATRDANAQVIINEKQIIPLVEGGDVSQFRVTPDGTRIVYIADQETDGVNELYSMPIEGGSAIKLSASMGAPGYIGALQSNIYSISRDSRYVIFLIGADLYEMYEMYSVAIEGGNPPVRLNSPTEFYDTFYGFSLSADSQYLVFSASLAVSEDRGLYSVPLSGGTPVRLDIIPIREGSVWNYKISENGRWVVFTTIAHAGNHINLYSVPIEGGAATKLNGPEESDALFLRGYFITITNDSSAVLFIGDQHTDGISALYKVAIDGGEITRLSTFTDGGGYVNGFHISPDGQWVVYHTEEIWDINSPRNHNLYTVPLSGGVAVKLNSIPNGERDIQRLRITPDSANVLFTVAGLNSFRTAEALYSVPIAGGNPITLSAPNMPGEELYWHFDVSENSNTAFYATALQNVSSANGIYSVPVTGGASTKLNIPLNANEGLGFFLLPRLQRVFYRIENAQTGSYMSIYSIPFGNGNIVTHISDFVLDVTIKSFGFSPPDYRTIYYLADQDTDEVFELYSSTLTCYAEQPHSADANDDYLIALSELLRSIQFYNIGIVSCMGGTEDGYFAGNSGDFTCGTFSGDYNPQDWTVDISELLRLIQLYNGGYYYACPGIGEDGFCPCVL